ncbi:MAG TPA: M3 family metallopeptidase, partial [Planctomycetota bacterium]|nr:M3 family metallopeptidase [Planctomycetota bacterium]
IDAAFERAEAAVGAIVAVPDAERTFENTVGAVDDLIAELFNAVRFAAFMESVHPDPVVRAAGAVVARELDDFQTRTLVREDLYRAVRAYAGTQPALAGDRARLLEELLRDFRRAGMELEPAARARVEAIDLELNEVGQEFAENIREDESFVALTAEELAGVPESQLARYGRSGELYVVDLKGSLVMPIFQSCEVPATRQKVSLAYSRRAGMRNVAVLERMIALRQEKALLLGYPTTAAYAIEIKMAETPERVFAFYDELVPKLRRKSIEDLDLLTRAKREHLGDPEAVIEPWDQSFYKERLLREEFAVDPQVVRQYFPLEAVNAGLFDLTQRLFGLRFVEATQESEARGRPLWHPDVRLYDVFDAESGEKLGEFYVDLHPRPGKFSHAAQFPVELRKRHADGSLTTPVVALVCNFSAPSASEPSLLQHAEVETFFHEFGHCLHSICSRVDLAWFAGTQVARDFVEAPSQMLENWIWDADVLQTFARHHATGEPIPRELVLGMVAAKNLGSGLATEGQVCLGKLDLAYHTDPDGVVDTTAVARVVHEQTRLTPWVEGSLGHASFGHLDGYHAGYYGYLWSLVYAADMFTPFAEGDLLDPALGRRYRDQVLARGGTVDALDLVREFLGREPSTDAFLRELGLAADVVEAGAGSR